MTYYCYYCYTYSLARSQASLRYSAVRLSPLKYFLVLQSVLEIEKRRESLTISSTPRSSSRLRLSRNVEIKSHDIS